MNRIKLIVLAGLALAAVGASASEVSGSAVSTNDTAAQSQAGGGAVLFAPDTTENSQVKYAASTAVAPALTSGLDTCMGSTSAGASGMSFGVSLGSTWTDKNCVLLKNAREEWNMGQHGAAIALLCTNDDVRYSISVSGGILDKRSDGAVIRRGCPMTKDEWIAKGRPLLDPDTGMEVKSGSVVTAAPEVVSK